MIREGGGESRNSGVLKAKEGKNIKNESSVELFDLGVKPLLGTYYI